jgi:pimeloyl-ACP methyl ester carboxylesterase
MNPRQIHALILSVIFLWATCTFAESVHFHRSYVELNWGQVHVLTATPKSASGTAKPAVVCFAPTPYSGNYYRHLMRTLAQDRMMLAPDYPGLGQSDPPIAELNVAGYADVMAEVLRSSGWGTDDAGPIDVCGYHTGTFVATELALRHPKLVRRIILIGIPFYEGADRSERRLQDGVVKPLPESLDALGQDWNFNVRDRANGVTLERGLDNFLESVAAWREQADLYRAVFEYPGERRAPLLEHPTLVLNPQGSLQEPSRAFSSLIDHAIFIALPDLKYGIFDTAPDVIADHARQFLDSP